MKRLTFALGASKALHGVAGKEMCVRACVACVLREREVCVCVGVWAVGRERTEREGEARRAREGGGEEGREGGT